MHTIAENVEVGMIVRIPLGLIKPNPNQPRQYFDSLSIDSLADSCLEKQDVHQPILVVKCDDENFVMIVDGERRWRAAGKAGLEKISCLIQPPMSEIDMFVMSAVTNFGREDMSPIEEAYAIKRIMDEKNLNQVEISALIGRGQAQISNMLKYLKLDREIQARVITRKLDKGAALQLATYHPKDQMTMLKILESEVQNRNGRKMHPNEASRFLRGVAEKKGVKAAPSKRGRELATHSDLTVRELLKNISLTQKSLREFNALTPTAIKQAQGVHFLDILQEMKGLTAYLETQIKRVEKMD